MSQGEQSEAEAVARAYFDAVAKRDVEAMAACWEPGSLDVLHGLVELTVPEDLRTWFGALFAAFPDWRFEVVDVLTDGAGKAAVQWHATGTFNGTGRFEGIVPNGRKVDVRGCDVLTVRDGKVVRNDAFVNGAEIARQLGALPPAGSAPEKALSALLNAKTKATAWLAKR